MKYEHRRTSGIAQLEPGEFATVRQLHYHGVAHAHDRIPDSAIELGAHATGLRSLRPSAEEHVAERNRAD